MASAHLQRWTLTLSGYSYSIKYKKSSLQGNVDALSRLPLPDCSDVVPVAPKVIASLEQLSTVPLSATKLLTLTSCNPILAKVRHFVYTGWPFIFTGWTCWTEIVCYRKHELSVQDDVLLWGSRVVIPPQAQQKVLELLHETHIGISRMKLLGRQFVWWPNMDSVIEQYVRNCATCQMSTNGSSYIHGNGPNPPGLKFMQTLWVHFLVRCFWYWSMLTPSGWKCTLHSQPLPLQQSIS